MTGYHFSFLSCHAYDKRFDGFFCFAVIDMGVNSIPELSLFEKSKFQKNKKMIDKYFLHDIIVFV